MTSYVWFVRGAKHAAMCRTSIESVRKADPEAQCVVITDEKSHAWDLDAGVWRIDSGMPIMLANLEAQVAARFIVSQDEPVVFLDTDTLVLEPLNPLADLTVTWRDSIGIDETGGKVEGIANEMPYNYGVIATQPGRAATEALIWMRERIRRMCERHQQWYGNQLALAELAGPRPMSAEQIDVRSIPWTLTDHGMRITVAKVPCEKWNYTPSKAGEAIHGKRKVLHFKGRSRALMESYAKRLGLEWSERTAA